MRNDDDATTHYTHTHTQPVQIGATEGRQQQKCSAFHSYANRLLCVHNKWCRVHFVNGHGHSSWTVRSLVCVCVCVKAFPAEPAPFWHAPSLVRSSLYSHRTLTLLFDMNGTLHTALAILSALRSGQPWIVVVVVVVCAQHAPIQMPWHVNHCLLCYTGERLDYTCHFYVDLNHLIKCICNKMSSRLRLRTRSRSLAYTPISYVCVCVCWCWSPFCMRSRASVRMSSTRERAHTHSTYVIYMQYTRNLMILDVDKTNKKHEIRQPASKGWSYGCLCKWILMHCDAMTINGRFCTIFFSFLFVLSFCNTTRTQHTQRQNHNDTSN